MFGAQGIAGVTPSFVSLMPEFGKWLGVHPAERCNSNEELLARAFLDIWAKSGRGEMAGGFKYSDGSKDMPRVLAPGFSIIGDTVPGRFYQACTAGAIEGGLIPRLLLIEYKGNRPPLNEGAMFAEPDTTLISHLKGLCERSLMLNQQNQPVDVQSTSEAREMFRAFDKECDRLWNESNETVGRALWNRAHLKSMKLAALVSVGVNYMQPVITPDIAHWAIEFAKRDCRMILDRFDKGEVTSGDVSDDRHRAILRTFRSYIARTTPMPPSYGLPVALQNAGILHKRYIKDRITKTAAFKAEGLRTPVMQLDQALKEMVGLGILREIGSHEQAIQDAGLGASTVAFYCVTDASFLAKAE